MLCSHCAVELMVCKDEYVCPKCGHAWSFLRPKAAGLKWEGK